LLISNECLRIYPANEKALYRRAVARSKLYPSDAIQVKLAMEDMQQVLRLSPKIEENVLIEWGNLRNQYNQIQSQQEKSIANENLAKTTKSSLDSQIKNTNKIENSAITNSWVGEEDKHDPRSQKEEDKTIRNASKESKNSRQDSGEQSQSEDDKTDEDSNDEVYAIAKNEYRCVPELERLQE